MQRLLCLLALIPCCARGNLLAAEPEATPGEWKLVSTGDNVALYRRSRSGPGHYETKAIGEIAASTAAVHAVIDDVDSYSRFMPYTVECRVLKREGDSVLTYQRISAPLVSDRDYNCAFERLHNQSTEEPAIAADGKRRMRLVPRKGRESFA